jgi:hypothetical protein
MSASLRVLLVSCLAIVGAACGGDDSTGPSQTSVGGSWMLSASNMSGQGVSCNLLNTPVSLSQSGTTFTGTYGPGTLSCQAGGQPVSVGTQGSIVNGSINGNSVTFDLDTQDLHHTGTISGNSMSGTARWTFDFGGSIGVVTLNGNWSAAKQ